jgi:homogentisate 1,2-dioxygenase
MGAKGTDEYAVMMDTFRPLKVARQALDIEDPSYHRSWIDAQHTAFNPPTT